MPKTLSGISLKTDEENTKEIIEVIILCHYLLKVEWVSRLLKTDRLCDKQIITKKRWRMHIKMDTRTLVVYYLWSTTYHKIDRTGWNLITASQVKPKRLVMHNVFTADDCFTYSGCISLIINRIISCFTHERIIKGCQQWIPSFFPISCVSILTWNCVFNRVCIISLYRISIDRKENNYEHYNIFQRNEVTLH